MRTCIPYLPPLIFTSGTISFIDNRHRYTIVNMHASSNAINDLLFGASAMVEPAVVAAVAHYMRKRAHGRKQRVPQIKVLRLRISVFEVFSMMGPRIFRRAFRMTFDAFWRLHAILLPHILTSVDEGRGYVRMGGREGGNYMLPPVLNGPISPSVCLGAALRYFAGGSPYDIMCVFAIGYSEVLTSVWSVVDAINKCSEFDISYPASLEA
jgi:hypothetical protein